MPVCPIDQPTKRQLTPWPQSENTPKCNNNNSMTSPTTKQIPASTVQSTQKSPHKKHCHLSTNTPITRSIHGSTKYCPVPPQHNQPQNNHAYIHLHNISTNYHSHATLPSHQADTPREGVEATSNQESCSGSGRLQHHKIPTAT